MRHNSHEYSKSRLDCSNVSLCIFPFTRSVVKKWTREMYNYIYNHTLTRQIGIYSMFFFKIEETKENYKK